MEKHTNKNDLSLKLEQAPQHDLNNNNLECNESKTKKRKSKKIFRVCFWTILAIPILVILFCCSVLVVEAISSPNGIPGNFEYKPCVERYGLMEPEIRKGDLIIVKKIDFSDLIEEEVIAYHLDGNDSIGRIISKSSDGVIVIADNDEACNEVFVPSENIQGKWYGFRIPIIGWIIMFIQDSWWVLIIIPAFIEMGVIMVNLLRKRFPKKIKNHDDMTVNEKGAV